METTELLKKVRKIEIKTRGLSNHLFSGEYHTVFKGRGMSFSEVREYQYGDDIRAIDWNVTARFNHPYVKIFEEERELTVMLLVDVSQSSFFGTQKMFKSELITELCAVLSFSAINNNDKVGVIFFSSEIEKFIPPKKGKTHILRIIRELLDIKQTGRTKLELGYGANPEWKEATFYPDTNISLVLEYFTNVMKKRSICFVLSDFIDIKYDDALKVASRKHDLIGLRIYDECETQLPDVGLMRTVDAETGNEIWLDTSNKKTRETFIKNYHAHFQYTRNAFLKSGADLVSINTKDDYAKALMGFFRNRGLRR
jgi:uncharacterized protein (DUF58 family)